MRDLLKGKLRFFVFLFENEPCMTRVSDAGVLLLHVARGRKEQATGLGFYSLEKTTSQNLKRAMGLRSTLDAHSRLFRSGRVSRDRESREKKT